MRNSETGSEIKKRKKAVIQQPSFILIKTYLAVML
jgi:hypothetical protein